MAGHRKDYVTPFYPGVNIIYGDADTGKSSILELINYLFGSKKLNLYEEIESSVKYAMIEVSLSGITYCVKRDIFNTAQLIEVYPCEYELIERYSPKKYIPTFGISLAGYSYYSDFLLESLNLPRLQIKNAPSKDDSQMSRFSFRDLFKYCYVDQDDLGSKSFLDIGKWAVEVKNRETFKYIFNILDSQIAELQAEISDKSTRKNKLNQKYEAVAEFLRDSELSSLVELDVTIKKLEQSIGEIQKHIDSINKRMTADNESYRGLKSVYDEITFAIKDSESKVDKANHTMQRYVRLKNDYLSDVDKFKSSLLAQELIGVDPEATTLCPVCDSKMAVEEARIKFEISESDKVNHEINSLKRRIKDLDVMIEEQRKTIELETVKLRTLEQDQKRAKLLIDENSIKMITPYLAERDTFIAKQASLKEKRSDIVSRLKIRNQHQVLHKTIESLESSIQKLNDNLEKLKVNSPSQSDILADLGDALDDFLTFVKIKNRKGVSISKSKFLPVVRGMDYVDINSGGLRTITSIGYLSSIFSMAISEDLNIPPFLMIDTVGKYLGKTKETYMEATSAKDDLFEGMSDPSKYRNIYEYLINMATAYEEESKTCQIILVDNDVPPEVQREYSGFVVAHYSSSGKDGVPVGLIDDAGILPS